MTATAPAPETMIEKPPEVADYAARAAFYELEYDDTADLPFLLAQVGPGVTSILEAPCGVGRVTLPLSATGRSITALDLEVAMIERLAERARQMPNGALIEGVVADLRAVRLCRRFDLVMSPAEGVQLFLDDDDLDRAITTLARHVDRGGRLLIDCATFDPAAPDDPRDQPGYFSPGLTDGTEILEWRRPFDAGGGPGGGGRMTRWRTQWNAGPTIRFRFRYLVETADAAVPAAFTSTLELRRPDRARIEAAAGAAGLVLHGLAGDRRGTPFTAGAPRMVFDFRRG